MVRSLEPLVVGRVIGDVLDMFTPAADLSVTYASKQVANGCEIKPSAAADAPTVVIQGPISNNDLYALVMVDPDAPSPSEPTFREWLHWIVVDIPEGSDANKGKEVVQYMGPQPPTGIHRYVLAVFKQNRAIGGSLRPPNTRSNFSTRQFASQNALGLPVAAVYFNSQKQPATKKR
ncbi:protein MOTHER of FT and TFL1-like [Cucurbita moschata]|uniref:Protein MOTHER of FT and TFL1-like n=2 Tax=Cucurbita TaxID=3660 RepID=A0A6J1EHJ1_CUCMO